MLHLGVSRGDLIEFALLLGLLIGGFALDGAWGLVAGFLLVVAMVVIAGAQGIIMGAQDIDDDYR